ncbi:hypothetical protein TGGT1_257000 [Toxoplasma gondii GT1]|uniref:Citrate transporter-like domain-containing protein n=2 Tax=Toxoplasma gondii TaxID=5811 RepID=S7UZB9_TOXGG|nr:hypothetical protein TGGT1_257000 [Toxoplasma gondii GT1]KAF4641465.1 hypothetical protein TGRH88_072750 [Toxoplasma gondii]
MQVKTYFIGCLASFQRRAATNSNVDNGGCRQGSEHVYGKSYKQRIPPFWSQALDCLLSTRKVWLTILSALVPLLLFVGLSPYDAKFRCLYIILVVIFNWLSAANDAVVVALYPLVLCPLLGVTGVKTLAQAYFRSVSFLMVGTCLLGASFTRTGLDKTVASLILNKSGSDPAILCLALMMTSFLLSMWINNASATVILTPIAGRIVSEWGRLNNRKNHVAHRHQIEHLSQLATNNEYRGGSVAPAELSLELPSESAATSPSATQETTLPTDSGRRLPPAAGHTSNSPENQDIINVEKLRLYSTGEPQETWTYPPAEGSVEVHLRSSPAMADDTISMASSKRDNVKEAATDTERFPQNLRHIRNMMYIGLAYAATLGGISTLSGSFVNLILVQLLETSYKFGQSAELSNPLTVGSWMAFSFPFALLTATGSWFVLGCLWLGVRPMLRTVSRLPVWAIHGIGSSLRRCGRRVRNLMGKIGSAGLAVQSWYRLRPRYACVEGSRATLATPELCSIQTTQPGDLTATGSAGGSVSSSSDASRSPDEACCNQQIEGPASCTLNFAQLEVLACLFLLIAVWLTRVSLPGGKPGWASLFPVGYVDDAVPVLFIGILFFFLPLEAPNIRCWGRNRKRSVQHVKQNTGRGGSFPAAVTSNGRQDASVARVDGQRDQNTGSSDAVLQRTPSGTRKVRQKKKNRRSSYTPILVYSYASKHIEWGALLLLGGGFALATSITETGLDKWLGSALLGLGNLSPLALVFCVVLITSSVTEIMSNTAAANVLLPILASVTSSIPYNPLLMVLPATVRDTKFRIVAERAAHRDWWTVSLVHASFLRFLPLCVSSCLFAGTHPFLGSFRQRIACQDGICIFDYPGYVYLGEPFV